MLTRTVLSLTLLAVAGTAAAAEDGSWDYWVRVQASVGSIGLGGEASFSDANIPGTTFDMADVGLDTSEITPAFELGLTTPVLSFHGYLGYQAWSTEGSATLIAPISFGGRIFSGALDSSATVSDLYAEFCWGPIELDVAGFSIGVAVHELGLQTELSSVGQTVELDESATIPTLAVRAYVAPLDMLEAEVMVHALSVPVGDASGSYLSASGQVAWYPISYVGLIAGYRYTMIDVEVESGDTKAMANVSLSGPFLGLAAQF